MNTHRARRAFRLAAALALALAASLGLESCGERIYSATVAGYVTESSRDANGDFAGINGAQVLVYTADPASGAAPDASVITATMSSGNNDGYWSHKVFWKTASPMFGDKGDSGTVWVKVKCAGYFPRTIKIPGVLSDSSNVIESIKLAKIRTASLKGRIVNENGAGVNGVNVVLDLGLTTDVDADFTATTATVDSVTGIFEFREIPWEDEDSLPDVAKAISGSIATTQAGLYVDDAAYYAETCRKGSPKPVVLASSAKTDLAAASGDWIKVRSAAFSVPSVRGTVIDEAAQPVAGVSVSYDLPSTDANPDDTVKTDSDGHYTFNNVKWTDPDPDAAAANGWVDNETIHVWVDDSSHTSIYKATNPLSVALASGNSRITVPTAMSVRRTSFGVSGITGTVKIGSKAVNGIPLVLDLASTSQQNDASATTQKNGLENGKFTFTDVSWKDEAPGSPDIEEATVTVDSADYEPSATTFTLTDGTDKAIGDIIIVRKTVWSYQATVSGRCLYRYTPQGATAETERGIEGVSVTFAVVGTPANLVSTTIGNETAVTDQNGNFQATLTWLRDKAYVPEADPSGTGDEMAISVSYSSNSTAGNMYSFNNLGSFTVKTYVNNGANILPEAVDTDPKS